MNIPASEYVVARLTRTPQRSVGPAAIAAFCTLTKIHRIQSREDAFHERCDHVRGLCVHDRVLAFRVQQRPIQALLHGMRADELRSLLGYQSFKNALRSLMICRSHVILSIRVAGQAFGGVTSTVERRFFADSMLLVPRSPDTVCTFRLSRERIS
jgi:hypothetical protein